MTETIESSRLDFGDSIFPQIKSCALGELGEGVGLDGCDPVLPEIDTVRIVWYVTWYLSEALVVSPVGGATRHQGGKQNCKSKKGQSFSLYYVSSVMNHG